MKRFYLQFGENPGPMKTVSVEHKEKPLFHHLKGLQYTATGYGSKIPTVYMIRFDNRWYRVYCRIYSNIGHCYAVINGERITVDSEG